MIKLILTVKRKSGLTPEQFRTHYENVHAPLAKSKLVHLVRYTRNYLSALPGQPDPPYDCMTEFWFDNREGMQESFAWTRSDAGQVLARDEENFMDRASMRAYFADESLT